VTLNFNPLCQRLNLQLSNFPKRRDTVHQPLTNLEVHATSTNTNLLASIFKAPDFKEPSNEQSEMMFSLSTLATRALRRLQQTSEAKKSTIKEVGWRWIFWQIHGEQQAVVSGKNRTLVPSPRRWTGTNEDTTTMGPWYNW
jgi:hypothetical protein